MGFAQERKENNSEIYTCLGYQGSTTLYRLSLILIPVWEKYDLFLSKFGREMEIFDV